MLKEKRIPHTDGCLENEKRIEKIEHILDITNGYKPVKTIKALAKGAVCGTVDLMQELSSIKNEFENKINKLELEIKKIKAKINEISEVINDD